MNERDRIKKLPHLRAVPFDTEHFLRQTALLSEAQVGMYISLLCIQNDDGTSRHFDKQELKKLIGLPPDPDIFKFLSVDNDGKYYVQWMEDAILEQREKYENKSRAQVIAWKKRKGLTY